MSGASSLKSLLLDYGKNVKTSWVDTFYFTIPCKISSMKGLVQLNDSVKPKYIDISLRFYFFRKSERDFIIICMIKDVLIPDGNYKIEFHCNINVFDEDARVFCVPCGVTVAVENFSLKGDLDLSSSDLEKELEFMILVKLIEYDSVVSDKHLFKEREFRENHPKIYKNESLIENLCYILGIPKLEDIFRGRQKLEFLDVKSKLIKRTVKYATRISEYLRCKKTSMQPFTDLKLLSSFLNYLLHREKERISHEDLITMYIEGHLLGLEFLIDISRDFLLHQLSYYEFMEVEEYENLMFEVFKSAVCVNDEDLLFHAEIKLKSAKVSFCQSERLLEKLKISSIDSRFVIHSLKQRLKKLESITRIGIGEEATSRFFESLEEFEL